MKILSSGAACIVVMVEDPGASNFLVPLVDAFSDRDVSLILFGVGVGARQLRERGYTVFHPPSEHNSLHILQACGCSLLIIGTSEDKHTPAFGLVRAARLAGIQTVGVVDAAVNAQFRFRGCSDSPLAHVTDWLIVPDEATADAFEQLDFPRCRISVVGHPARDLARQRVHSLRLAVSEASCTRENNTFYIVFVSELSDGLDKGQYTSSKDYTLKGRGDSSARTVIVAEELLDARSVLHNSYGIHCKLVLRLHPKQAKDDLGALCEEFDEVSIGGDPLEVVANADLVVGMTSMLLVQAFDMGLRCLSILPRQQEKTWLSEIASGAIPSVLDRASLRGKLLHLLLSPSQSSVALESIASRPDPLAVMMSFLDDIHENGPIKVRG